MRTTVIYIILVLAVAASEIHGQESRKEKKKICEPGSQSKIDCNTCTCSADGTALGCTRKGCFTKPPVLPSPDSTTSPLLHNEQAKVCEPGSLREIPCQSCHCNADGTSESCSRRCPRSIRDFLFRYKRNSRFVKIAEPKTLMPSPAVA